MAHADHAHEEHAHDHPGEGVYIKVAIVLAIITLIEVAIYYVDWVHDNGVLVPALVILSAVKFATVIGYFMHLKFDDKRLLWTFLIGLFVAFSVILALKVLHDMHPIDMGFDMIVAGAPPAE